MSRREHISAHFQQHYGRDPEVVCHGPGRVNLIGDHTDYNDGFVLPAAINFGTDIAASKRNDRKVRILAVACRNETAEFDLDSIAFSQTHMWLNYVQGTLQALMAKFPALQGADLVVNGDVPQGTGLSSSASFEVTLLKTFSDLYQLNLDGVDAALMGQRAENSFVGCNCGIMDQLITAMGSQGNAMLLDCRSLTFKNAPIPDDLALVIVNSNVKRGLVDSEYNIRRKQCEEVARFFDKPALRDITLEQLNAAREQLSDVLYRRAKHVITENTRTEAALVALNQQDIKTLGRLMSESHLSLKDDFETTVPQINHLVAIIAEVLGEQGGARMTGGGFGGCVVALTPLHLVAEVKAAVVANYTKATQLTADIYVCTAENGAFV